MHGCTIVLYPDPTLIPRERVGSGIETTSHMASGQRVENSEKRRRVGTHTICQHCYGNNRGFKAGGIIRLWNAARHTVLVHNDAYGSGSEICQGSQDMKL